MIRRTYDALNSLSRDHAGDSGSVGYVWVWDDRRSREARLALEPAHGGLVKEPLKEGYYWHAPWNNVFEYDVRYQSYTEKVDVLTADDLTVHLHATITMRPIAEEVYFLAQEVGHHW